MVIEGDEEAWVLIWRCFYGNFLNSPGLDTETYHLPNIQPIPKVAVRDCCRWWLCTKNHLVCFSHWNNPNRDFLLCILLHKGKLLKLIKINSFGFLYPSNWTILQETDYIRCAKIPQGPKKPVGNSLSTGRFWAADRNRKWSFSMPGW